MNLGQYVSQEEYWYSKWLDVLIEQGYVHGYDYQVPIPVCFSASAGDSGIWNLNDLNYTADFNVWWTKKAESLFFGTKSTQGLKSADSKRLHYAIKMPSKDGSALYLSTVDIKGKFAGVNNNSAITFPLIQKTLYAIHGIYVQKIVPFAKLGLFNYTFTPSDYITTSTGKARKVLFKTRTLDEYIQLQNTPVTVKRKTSGSKTTKSKTSEPSETDESVKQTEDE
jgi:hypothetical protein